MLGQEEDRVLSCVDKIGETEAQRGERLVETHTSKPVTKLVVAVEACQVHS